ncbi:uncharacterized protein LOC115447633 isoform X2 [Manduca sexta]|uniref:PPIase cyclophilin-type domain-containing protein n=1 Tax=Manduca sexta TaxID=7130 RepID=A0A921ZFE1_MANSE|nr:uncharacterized protein LOC115447633 isoform X2 [Manduca sexta]KAG6456600.1 hypothetical protein O3G_MSEX009824 [Manduca sexta]
MPLLNNSEKCLGYKNAKVISHHPWERRIKDEYANKIKHAHNSINNPVFPKENKKGTDKNRAQFTVIGNRVTKEFIYCIHLLKGLHKYRSKNFEAPVIRGVTTVEWPYVWNDLKLRFGGLAYCLKSQCAVLLNDKLLGGENELKNLIETKYSYHICPDYYQESINQFATFIRSSGRPCAYMHFSINDEHIGTMIFMLYADLLPLTSENFLRLCKSKKGGYGGTPVHRIVKDCWIQCGGYGLKSTDLACENFIVPHDRRGVLCMANDGRHMDCSTQFFILLQPAQWMAHKYVAFGQLIEGEGTLQKIENVPTWYESPTSEIIIHKAGILNMECQDIAINKGTVDYIDGHIEDLVVLANFFYEIILDKVFQEVEARRLAALEMQAAATDVSENEAAGIRSTQRFLQKKEDIEKQLQKSQVNETRIVSRSSPTRDNENNDFDVEVYDYEPEEYSYQHVSFGATASPVLKPKLPYYLPLTDVPYRDEVDSTPDLRKFLRGDYCLESDLIKDASKKIVKHSPFPSELFKLDDEESDVSSQESLESFEEREIRRYLKLNVDRVSFAGDIVRGIAKGVGKLNIFDESRKSELISDNELRKFRMASVEYRSRDKKVSITVPDIGKTGHKKIKRRQTGFVRPQDLERAIRSTTMLAEEEDSATAMTRKVRIAPTAAGTSSRTIPPRRPTGFVRAPEVYDSDTEVKRQSVLTRLYDDLTHEEPLVGPTLKDYKPMSETRNKNMLLLTFSPNSRIKSDENTRERYLRHSANTEGESYEHVLNLQHGKKVARKISSDYVNTIDQMEQKLENSIRSIEFAKMRPAISVTEYQKKNQKHLEETRRTSKSQVHTVMKPKANFGKQHSSGGLRLPGDTPLYSSEEDEQAS